MVRRTVQGARELHLLAALRVLVLVLLGGEGLEAAELHTRAVAARLHLDVVAAVGLEAVLRSGQCAGWAADMRAL
jgi:hypothetical protein